MVRQTCKAESTCAKLHSHVRRSSRASMAQREDLDHLVGELVQGPSRVDVEDDGHGMTPEARGTQPAS